MKDPTDPVGPAFDKARDEDAALRARRVAALTPEQRSEYDRRGREEEQKIDAEKERLAETRKDRIEREKARRDGELKLTPTGVRATQTRQNEMQATAHIHGQDKAAIERARMSARERLDNYLLQAEQSRLQQGRDAGRDTKAARDEFNKGARDPSLSRAFSRAKQRQDQGQEQTRSREAAPERDREARAGNDEKLKRAFDKARQHQNQHNRQINRER